MVRCAVANCKNYPGKKSLHETIRYHGFPKEPKLLREWIKFCGKNANFDLNKDKICSEHFEESDYRLKDILLNTPLKSRRLKDDAVPTKHVIIFSAKKKMQKKRIRKELDEDAIKSYEKSPEDNQQEGLPKDAEDIETIVNGTGPLNIETLEKEPIELQIGKLVRCSVSSCKNQSTTTPIRYHSFPKHSKNLDEWIKVCGKSENVNINVARICSNHFKESDYRMQDILLNVPMHKRRLKENAIPTKFTNLPIKKSGRKTRESKRIRKELVEEMITFKQAQEKKCAQDCLSENSPKTESNRNTNHNRYQSQSSSSSECSPENSPTRKGGRQWTIKDLIVEPLHSLEGLKEMEYEMDCVQDNFPGTSDVCERVEMLEEYETINEKLCTTSDSAEHSETAEKANKKVQTEVDYDCDKEFRIIRLEVENRVLRATVKKLLKEVKNAESERYQLNKMFTPGQLRRLREPNKKLNWSDEDISAAEVFYSNGIRNYQQLRKRGFPLPGPSTFRQWMAKSKENPQPEPGAEVESDPGVETESEPKPNKPFEQSEKES